MKKDYYSPRDSSPYICKVCCEAANEHYEERWDEEAPARIIEDLCTEMGDQLPDHICEEQICDCICDPS